MHAILALAILALPQQDPNRGTDFILNRMKERLGLSEEQTSKVREILTQDGADRAKLDEARTAKVNALLDDEQKKKYEEMRGQFGGGRLAGAFGGGRPGGGPFGGGRQMGQVQLDDLKRELGLTDDQMAKIKPILDEFNTQVQKRGEEMRQNGFQGLNFADEMRKFQDAIKELSGKVKEHLNDEQKAKVDAFVDRTTGWMRAIPQLLGNRGGAGGTPSGPSRPSVEDRVRAAMDAVRIEKEDERSAVKDLVEKIVRAQYDLEDHLKAQRERLGEAARNRDLSDAAVEDRIKESLEERRKRERALGELQKALVDVVTSRQELELMALGILK
jgi:hypothetical protein